MCCCIGNNVKGVLYCTLPTIRKKPTAHLYTFGFCQLTSPPQKTKRV